MATSCGICSICDSAFTFDNIFALKCGHTFHGECINTWIQQAKNCPKCRTENSLTDIIKLYVDDEPINTINIWAILGTISMHASAILGAISMHGKLLLNSWYFQLISTIWLLASILLIVALFLTSFNGVITKAFHNHSSDFGLHQIIVTKKIIISNSKENGWNAANTKATISPDGLEADTLGEEYVYALKGFAISLKRKNFNNNTIVYYFEVKQQSAWADSDFRVGLSAGHNRSSFYYSSSNSYGIRKDSNNWCKLSGQLHAFEFEWPYFATKPIWNGHGNVIGCGLVLKPQTNVAIFFTLNGILLGKQIPIRPSMDCLFPSLHLENACFEANFGNNPAKPFKYDISKCPGLSL